MLLACPMHRFAVSDANGTMLLSVYEGPFDNVFTLHPKYSVTQYSPAYRQLSLRCVKIFPPEYDLVDEAAPEATIVSIYREKLLSLSHVWQVKTHQAAMDPRFGLALASVLSLIQERQNQRARSGSSGSK